MPVAQSLMKDLTARYGPDKAQVVYDSMLGEGSGPFAPGGKYRGLHERWAERNGVPPSHATRTKKKR